MLCGLIRVYFIHTIFAFFILRTLCLVFIAFETASLKSIAVFQMKMLVMGPGSNMQGKAGYC